MRKCDGKVRRSCSCSNPLKCALHLDLTTALYVGAAPLARRAHFGGHVQFDGCIRKLTIDGRQIDFNEEDLVCFVSIAMQISSSSATKSQHNTRLQTSGEDLQSEFVQWWHMH